MFNDKNQDVWIWNSYTKTEQGSSIPAYVEENSSRIRNKYLAFIHDLGQTLFGKRSLVEHLEQKPGMSFWWMSLLVEKSFGKSPYIIDCLKLIGLEEILKERRSKSLKILLPA